MLYNVVGDAEEEEALVSRGGGECTHFMHGRSRTTRDPRGGGGEGGRSDSGET